MPIFGKTPDNEPQGSSPATPSPTPSPRPARPAQPSGRSPAAADATDRRSFLKSGCRLEGEFTGEGSFDCGGTFDGTIEITGDVVVGHGGKMKAEVKARRISIEGRLHGDATGLEKIEVGASGHVEGDVRAPAVQFAEGAFFEGNVEMRRPAGQTAPHAAADTEKAED